MTIDAGIPKRLDDAQLERQLLRALRGDYRYDPDRGDLRRLRRLLEEHEDAIDPHTTRLTDDRTPLIGLAWNAPLARYLVEERGVDPHDANADRRGRTALHARDTRLDACRYLLEEVGVDVYQRDHCGHTCIPGLFFKAVIGGDLEYLKSLFALYGRDEDEHVAAVDVNACSDPESNATHYGFSLFQLAVRNNQLETVRYLVDEQGADVNAPGYLDAYAPICDAHSAEMIQYLLDQGTDLTRTVHDNDDGDEHPILTAVLVRTIEKQYQHLTERLMSEYSDHVDGDEHLASIGHTLLHHAAHHRNLDAVRCLVTHRRIRVVVVDDVRNASGQTPLHAARSVPVAEYLISSTTTPRGGADPHETDDDGNTVAMHWMSEYPFTGGMFDQVLWLIRNYGVDLDATNKYGDDLLAMAVDNDEVVNDGVESLRERAIVGYFRLLKDTAAACRDTDLDSLRNLVKSSDLSIDRRARDEKGNTWFLQACANGNLEQVKFWILEDELDSQQYLGARNNRGETALHLAAQSGNLELLQWLVGQGSPEWLHMETDKFGGTALHSACEAGRVPVIQWLVGEQGLDMLRRDDNGLSGFDQAIDAGHLDVMVWYNVSSLGLNQLLKSV